MTLIAGIVSRKLDVPVPAQACDALRRLISRNPHDDPTFTEYRSAFFGHLDIGALGPAAWVDDDQGRLTFVAGEPLLGSASGGRQADTEQIHRAFTEDKVSAVLQKANGVFCAVCYNPANGELILISDKLGIRPIYYWTGDECVIFAGALRILEELAEVPKVLDVRAVTEIVGLGYALANRTPYSDIKALRPAQIVKFNAGGVSSETYYRWDTIEPCTKPESELLSEVYQRFESGIARRIGDDKTTSAYLSGGLDSRCIVAALRAKHVEVHTYNFARPGTQDLIFGREFAREIGTIHSEVPKGSGDMVPDYSQLMADAISAKKRDGKDPEHPGVVWSGEGGSVALGHVHLTEEMVAWMRGGEIDRTISEYIQRESAAVSPRLFNHGISAGLANITEKGIKAELDRLNSPDPARNFYLFLLLNDQHRKLARHFENIDLHRLEFQLPFFDSDLLKAIIALPIDICLRHRFYVKWLSLFDPTVSSLPWQVYPGHQPCPIPVPDDLDYQWEAAHQVAERSTQRRRESTAAAEMLRADDFPDELLNKRDLKAAALVHRTGLRNYQYLLGPAATFHAYWQKCGGQFELSDTEADS